MRRIAILALFLAACGDSTGIIEPPPGLPPIAGTYDLVAVNDEPLPVTVGWYTIQSATRTVAENGAVSGSYAIVFSTVEADTAAHYPVTLTESGDWEVVDGRYVLTVTQQHYRRTDGQDHRWTSTDTLHALVNGRVLETGTLLYSSATVAYQRR